MQRTTQYWLRLALLIATSIFVVFATPVILPFVVSLVFTLVLNPLVNSIQDLFQKKLHCPWFPRFLAIVPAFILVGAVTAVIIIYILLPFMAELTRLINNLPFLIAQFMEIMKNIQQRDPSFVLPTQLDVLLTMSLTKLGNYSVEIAQKGIYAVFSFAGTVLELLLVPIMTFYLLKDGRRLKQKMIHIFSEPTAGHITEVVNEIHDSLGRYLRGQLVLATNMFIIIFIVATVFHLPYPLVLALLAAIAEWIPIIGPFISAGPAIVLAALVSGHLAIKVALTYAIILLLDGQVVMPKIMGRSINLHPLVIITVIFVGGSFYGVVGMMVAVPITAILQIVLSKLWYFNRNYRKIGEKHEHNLKEIERTHQG